METRGKKRKMMVTEDDVIREKQITDLPDDIFKYYIFTYLDTTEIIKFGRTCQHFHHLIQESLVSSKTLFVRKDSSFNIDVGKICAIHNMLPPNLKKIKLDRASDTEISDDDIWQLFNPWKATLEEISIVVSWFIYISLNMPCSFFPEYNT